MNVWISNTTVEQELVLTWNRPSDVTVQMVTDLVAHLKCLLVMVVFQNTSGNFKQVLFLVIFK